MHLFKGCVWENAYSSLKSVERSINVYIILFDNHSPFQDLVICYSTVSIFSEMYYTNMFKIKKKNLQKMSFCPRVHTLYYFFPLNFVILQVVYECFYSLKHISLTYFRPIS